MQNFFKCIFFALFGLIGFNANSQSFPEKTIKILVPITAGASGDIIARILAKGLSEEFNSPVIVENKPGAGGSIATMEVIRSKPDGYTLLMAHSTLTIWPALQDFKSYDMLTDMSHVAQVVRLPLVLVSSKKAPYQTFEEMVNYLKNNGKAMSYATSGIGAPSHIEGARLLQRLNLDIKDVPYSNAGQAMVDTIDGRAAFYLPALPAGLSQIQSGKLNALAVGSAKRMNQIPDVQTLAEKIGQKNYTADLWYGIMGPANIPANIVLTLQNKIKAILDKREIQQAILNAGFEVSFTDSKTYSAEVKDTTVELTKIVKELGLYKEKSK